MAEDFENVHMRRVVATIASDCKNPARLLELYYWSKEPNLLPIIRGLASLPDQTRSRFGAFLRDADPNAIVAETSGKGEIRLVTRCARKAAKTA